MKKKLLSLALALVLCLSLSVPALAAEEKKDSAPASTEEKKDQTPAEGEEKKDQTPAEGEEKKDESKTPAEGEEKKDESKTPAEGEEKKDESKAPAGEEKKDESKAPAEGTEKKDETPAAAPKFTDVAPTSPFAAAIDWAVEQGITNGTTPTTFGPSNTCTVSHILTFLWRANGKPGAKEGVADRQAALEWFESEIIDNHGDPDAACTRSMAVLYMWQAAGSPEVETEKEFTDVAADAEYASAVAWAVENGVTSGTGDGTTFSPDNTCTRGQIVTFLYRANQAAAAPAEGEASK